MQTQKAKQKAEEAEAKRRLLGQARHVLADKDRDLKAKEQELDSALANQVHIIASTVGHLLQPFLNEKTGRLEADGRQTAIDGVDARD